MARGGRPRIKREYVTVRFRRTLAEELMTALPAMKQYVPAIEFAVGEFLRSRRREDALPLAPARAAPIAAGGGIGAELARV